MFEFDFNSWHPRTRQGHFTFGPPLMYFLSSLVISSLEQGGDLFPSLCETSILCSCVSQNSSCTNSHLGIEFYLFVSHNGMKDRGSVCNFRNARSTFRNLHVDPLSFITLWKMNRLKLNPYIKFYTLSKLSRFGNEIFVFFNAQQGGILNSCQKPPAHTSRQPFYWRMVVKIFLMFIVAENTRSVNIR